MKVSKRAASKMQSEKKQRWMQLCEQAAVEQDPHRMLELVTEINDLLEEKERRLGIVPPRVQQSQSPKQ